MELRLDPLFHILNFADSWIRPPLSAWVAAAVRQSTPAQECKQCVIRNRSVLRHFQLAKGTFLHRAGFAVTRVFVTGGDSGNAQFNFYELAGAADPAGMANAIHPPGDCNFADAMSIWGTDMGWDAFTYFVKEFWADLRRKLKRDKNQFWRLN